MKRNSSHVNPPQNQAVSSDDSEDESKIVESKRKKQEMDPLKMGVMVEKIFSFLDGKSLKNARLVNQLWNIEGAKMLFTKFYMQIPSELQRRVSLRTNKTMHEFKAFLAYKVKEVSMIPKITIKTAGDVELWKSLGVFGQQLNSLNLTTIDDQGELLHTILDLLPNLKYLQLKSIDFYKNGRGIIKILTSVFSKGNNKRTPLIISNMNLRPGSLQEFEETEKFSECKNIRIKELSFATLCLHSFSDVPHYEARIAKVITNLISTSQNILETLTLFQVEIYLSLIQFPCMTTLSNLRLLFYPQIPGFLHQYKFSSCFRFTESLPKLKCIIIDCGKIGEEAGADFFSRLFEHAGPAPSVKSVVYYDSPAGYLVDPLWQNFPNTGYISIKQAGHSKRMFESICKHATNVRSMAFEFDLDRFFEEIAELDSIFTGFDPETVNKMRNSPDWMPGNLAELTQLRVNPSILDLKKLLSFELTFSGTGENYMTRRTLAIAGDFAFRFLPDDTDIRMHVIDMGAAIEYARPALEEVSKLENVTVAFAGLDWVQ